MVLILIIRYFYQIRLINGETAYYFQKGEKTTITFAVEKPGALYRTVLYVDVNNNGILDYGVDAPGGEGYTLEGWQEDNDSQVNGQLSFSPNRKRGILI